MYVTTPYVEIIACTGMPLETIYTAFRQCYFPGDIHTFADDVRHGKVAEEKQEALIRKVVASGHESPIEHVSFTFAISGVSRALTHQLVRHRLASYSQQSQRYVKMDDLAIVMPDLSYLTEEQQNLAKHAIRTHATMTEVTYRRLEECGVKAEDCRSVLPNSTATSIVVTMNCRSLLNFFQHRCCYRAQGEINAVARKMLELVKVQLPVVFENAGARCITLKRCPEAKPCGKRPWVEYPVTI